MTRFAKLNGLGNDFVFIDNMSGDVELDEKEVAALCDRHFGIGADGVILVQPSPRPECAAYMHYINSDGTLAQMCGNGVRCFAKYLVDRGFVNLDERSLVADTLAGPKPISFETNASGKMTFATVDMGKPILDPDDVPIAAEANFKSANGESLVANLPVCSPWGEFEFTAVSMGNPHAVCFIDNFEGLPDALFKDADRKCLETFDVDSIGSFYESNPIFPEKSNIEFAHIVDDHTIDMRVYERGCGETLACGTGACATNVAAAITGRASRTNTIRLKGGDLNIDWTEGGNVMMTGPASQSFTGEF